MMGSSILASRSSMLALILLGLALPTFAGFEEGFAAYKKHDFERTFQELRPLAEIGHPYSQYVLGAMYCNGKGVARDLALCYGWIKLAADGGCLEAIETEKKLREHIDEEKRAAGSRQLEAYTVAAIEQRLMPKVLPNCEYEGQTAPKMLPSNLNPDDFFPREAILRGQSGSVTFEILVAPDGRAREVRVVNALPPGVFEKATQQWVRASSFQPSMKDGKPVFGVLNMVMLFQLWSNVPQEEGKLNKDPAYRKADKVVNELHTAAEAGDPEAQYVYAQVIAGHPRYRVYWSEALPWMTKAATAGLKEAQYQLGQSLLRGRGCKEDEQKAIEWLKLSAQQGYVDAQMTLATIMARTRDTQDKTLFWLERAASAKDAGGRRRLAAFLASTPLEPARDPQRAFALAAELIRADQEDPLLFEIRAAARAGLNEFSAAAADEKIAIKKAARLGWDTQEMNERLANYTSGRSWFGELIPW